METAILNYLGAIPAFVTGALVMFGYLEHAEVKSPEAMHQRKRQEFFTAYMMKVDDRWGLSSLKRDAQRWAQKWQDMIAGDPQAKRRSDWEHAYYDTLNIVRLIEARMGELEQSGIFETR